MRTYCNKKVYKLSELTPVQLDELGKLGAEVEVHNGLVFVKTPRQSGR